MQVIGKTLAAFGGLVMAFGFYCLGHVFWSAHTTGSYLSKEVFLWQGRSFVVYLGYGIAMVGCLIWRATGKENRP
jgi:hypothetical protein